MKGKGRFNLKNFDGSFPKAQRVLRACRCEGMDAKKIESASRLHHDVNRGERDLADLEMRRKGVKSWALSSVEDTELYSMLSGPKQNAIGFLLMYHLPCPILTS